MRLNSGRTREAPPRNLARSSLDRHWLGLDINTTEGAAVSLSTAAFAGANDYVFEPVKTEVKKGDDVIVSVRLKHKATGKPVTDAVIVQTRIDMSPDAMG